MSAIRVLIADDEREIREAMAEMIERDASLKLVGSADDADEAIRLAKEARPDVALLDVKMPGGGGVRAAAEIRTISPLTKVVALSAYEDRATVLEMLRAGASGYLVKGASIQDILTAILQAVQGEGVLSGGVTAEVIDELTGQLDQQARKAEERRRREEPIRRVLTGDGLTVVHQPILHLPSGRMVGAEALSRFEVEPRRGPDLWFRDAAETGLTVELELAAGAAAIELFGALPAPLYLSLNLSPATILDARLAPLVSAVPPERLVIEITEHAKVEDYGELERALRDVRAAGARLAVDDAGAGFASLRHILLLDPDLIKLDLSLTRDIDTSGPRRALAAALISFAHEIDAAIIAEGIETSRERETLIGLGVEYGQGYLLGKPGPLPLHPIASPTEVTGAEGWVGS